ncbi:replication factor A protein [Trifolium medium]|uniref:Replication factor A protein n=1 Tax=Trifolium medium TaxID=97028 RepID=A0A392M250_9FABA|nr:replication factor A protein [Trifolium medium]
MSFFSVSPQSGYYRTTLHPYKLFFQIKTKVQISQTSEIGNYGLSLTNFAEIGSHTHDYEFLDDKASLQNVINTTRIFVNPDIVEGVDFKNGIVVHGIEVDTAVPLIGGRARPSPDEEFLRMHLKKNLLS